MTDAWRIAVIGIFQRAERSIDQQPSSRDERYLVSWSIQIEPSQVP